MRPTKQQFLNHLVAVSFTGGFPSWGVFSGKNFNVDLGPGCLYRGPDGRKCVAGHVIPDDLYHPDMEGMLFHAIASKYALAEHFPLGMNTFDLYAAQKAHDRMAVACHDKNKPWDHDEFVASLLTVECFKGMVPALVRGQVVQLVGKPFDKYAVVYGENGHGNILLTNTLGGWLCSVKRHEILEVCKGKRFDPPADIVEMHKHWTDA